MSKLQNILNEIFSKAFKNAGYEVEENDLVVPCKFESMGDFQCNSCLGLAKKYKKAPIAIATDVEKVLNKDSFEKCEVAMPGYINIVLKSSFVDDCLKTQTSSNNNIQVQNKKKIVIDYGGANVAKPLHVGHLRTANIGESIKRICRFVGNEVIGDVHLGDWGLQMGMLIAELERRHPSWPFFDPNYTGEYPKAPITNADLETLYPEASKHAKADEKLMEEAKRATFELQNGRRGYKALWQSFIDISKRELKKSYDTLNVNFDLWLGESDTLEYYEDVIQKIIQKGLAYESQGALVVDISKDDDKNPMPPFILRKSDGAVLYSTTDLATIVQREKELNPDQIIYVVDNRQELHFTQLFRCVNKVKLFNKQIQYNFVGFGTMNGTDGKPYKTRDGGVMQLNHLIADVKEKAKEKINASEKSNLSFTEAEIEEITNKVALSALKFADLSTYRSRDYIFDIDKFCSFDGKTGPYILYTITRANSILEKANFKTQDLVFNTKYFDKQLALTLLSFSDEVLKAYNELAPNYLCEYAFKLANLFNSFYNTCNIINEKDQDKKLALLSITHLVKQTLKQTMDLLAIETLNKM